ncbi:DUF397 domain-containing protein [Streptomyces phage Ididsumtinwong]|uniref:DUF397 domain-containing protein n=2 Tax=Austintatiousvirus ididsumtinwong TaxID=2734220 RepID=A0A1J0MBV2_9CAUD|nr:DUF397 domain-containing protein [Streptomyces phage Ididsumtinwong]APD18505.1 hypothetical protein SEA_IDIDSUMTINWONG_30 [Streptomyces phage Ididsumtinwong]APD18724.1 hypothetical protein SEA_BIOSCUM_30 [Streptomyces phage Bioscum]
MTEPVWRTSTYSGSNDNCVEVADNTPRVLVRDTKDHGAGMLTVAPAAWSSFTSFASDLAE